MQPAGCGMILLLKSVVVSERAVMLLVRSCISQICSVMTRSVASSGKVAIEALENEGV
jgi:hypothetical protein